MQWVIFPMLNPGFCLNKKFILTNYKDGYEYSRQKDNLWRKNRNLNVNLCRANQTDPESYIVPCKGDCIGVDLNRNYDAKWGTHEINKDPCGHIFQVL